MSPSTAMALVSFTAVALIFFGVVLPAVWSVRPERRCAATRVLRLLLRGAVDLVAALRVWQAAI